MFPKLKRLHAFFFHEKKNVTAPVLVIGYKKLLKFRNLFFRNNQHSSPLRNEIMVCKNHRSTFVAVVENLLFHTVDIQSNGLFVGWQVSLGKMGKIGGVCGIITPLGLRTPSTAFHQPVGYRTEIW